MSAEKKDALRPRTLAVHGDFDRSLHQGAVAMPIFSSSTYCTGGGSDYHGLRYGRHSNTPNHVALSRKLALLERCERGLVTASGMAAISTTILALLGEGDHMLAQDCLYGGTHTFATQEMPGVGRRCTFVDGERPESWERALEPRTKAIYVESVTNPLMRVIDLEAVVAFARRHGLLSVIDNTFASPANFNPATLGFDLVLHSATKYLNGHTDLIAGCVLGRTELVRAVRHKLGHFGGSLEPQACAELDRGLKTLHLRVEAQNRGALELARCLERHPAVSRVAYPGLESHPDHARAKRWFAGFGGMLALELRGGAEAAERLLSKLSIPFVAPSLGGVETLVTRPALTSHSGMTHEERNALGITDGLVRVSVGIEAAEDLIADFERALG